MSTKKFSEIMKMDKHQVMHMIIKWELNKKDFTRLQFKKFKQKFELKRCF